MSDFSLTDIFNMREKEIYYVSNHISKHYKRVEIPKKTKGVRILYIPSKKLMYMQRIILNAFLSEYKISECATAYHKGSTLVSNALPHRNKKYVLKLDIEDFFGSITYGRVYKMFLNISLLSMQSCLPNFAVIMINLFKVHRHHLPFQI